jgi:hypothetical protein
VVVPYQDGGNGFIVVLDDIVGHPKMFGKTRVVYVIPKCLGPRFLWDKAVSLSVTVPTAVLNAHEVLSACSVILPMGLMAFHMLQRSVLVARSKT